MIFIERNTIQRALVLEIVKKLHAHPTADEVYAVIKAEHPNISRSTVYRNLKQLADAGKIGEVEVPGSADHFDYQNHHHYHIKCTKCGKIFDLDMDYIPDIGNLIKDNQGFQITGHNLVFTGICPRCLSENKHMGV